MAEITLNNDNFKSEVLEHEGRVLVDFWAAWCGPCKMLAPVVHEVAEKNADVLKVGKVNIDECMELAAMYGIVSIPTLILFENGQAVNKIVGFVGAEEIEAMWK